MVIHQQSSRNKIVSDLDSQPRNLLRVKSSGSSTHSTNCMHRSKTQLPTNKVACESQSHIIGKKRNVKFTDVGFPGHLTKSEFEAYRRFCKEVNHRGGAFRNTVFCFGELEDTTYAHCRWLRARKFNIKDTIQMVEEATECRSKAAHNSFYPDPSEALGAEKSIYLAQYPQLYSGVSKHGCPVFISKPGALSANGLENITTLEGIFNFHWWAMMHDFGDRLRYQANNDPNFKRFETVAIIDLANLSSSQISRRALNIVKVQTEIDSLCFPETLNHMIVINAPSFFSMTWKVISAWVDERTAAKVEIISSRRKWEKKLKELIDIDQLPSDYGGKAQSTKQTIQEDMKYHEGRDLSRLFSKTISVRSTVVFDLNLKKGEIMDNISVFTRSLSGASFYISNEGKNLKGISVVHEGKGLDIEKPTRVTLPGTYCGPAKFTIKVESKSNALSSDSFLFIGKIKSPIELPVIRPHRKESGTSNEEMETELENIPLNGLSSSDSSSNEARLDHRKRKSSDQFEREVRDLNIGSQSIRGTSSSVDTVNSCKEQLQSMSSSQENIVTQQEVGYYTPWCCGGIESIKDILQYSFSTNL